MKAGFSFNKPWVTSSSHTARARSAQVHAASTFDMSLVLVVFASSLVLLSLYPATAFRATSPKFNAPAHKRASCTFLREEEEEEFGSHLRSS